MKTVYFKYLSAVLGSAMITSVYSSVDMAMASQYIYIFMKPIAEILEIASTIIRCYSISFLLLPLYIFSTYYFQALMKPKAAFAISVFRGFILNGTFITLLPVIAGANSIWFVMPITELLVAVYAVYLIVKFTRAMPKEGTGG